MSEKTPQSYLREHCIPLLDRGINTMAIQLSDLRLQLPSLPHGKRFASGDIVALDDSTSMFACAPASVCNALLAVGIDPKTEVPLMGKRLYAAELVRKRNQPRYPALLKINSHDPSSNILWTTPDGITHLFEIAKSPLGQSSLQLKVFEVEDPGVVHQTLLNGCSAVYIDNALNHSITLVGAGQKGKEAVWFLVPPDDITLQSTKMLRPDLALVREVALPPQVFYVDPHQIMGYAAPPFWVVAEATNSWQPPEKSIEYGDEIIIAE